MSDTKETDAAFHKARLLPAKHAVIAAKLACKRFERERDTLAAALRELSELPLPGAAEEIIEAALAEVKGG